MQRTLSVLLITALAAPLFVLNGCACRTEREVVHPKTDHETSIEKMSQHVGGK